MCAHCHCCVGRTHSCIVINEEQRGSGCGLHPSASALVGRVKQKLAPRGELLAAHKRPPCDSIMVRLMRSPMPVTWGLVVKKALKICSACCEGRPTPLSVTDTKISSCSAR